MAEHALLAGAIHNQIKVAGRVPRMGYMSAHPKNGVVLRCVEFTHSVEKALAEAGIDLGKEY